MNFAIYFASEGYKFSMPKLMGRNAASATLFLRGLLKNSESEFPIAIEIQEDDDEYRSQFEKFRPRSPRPSVIERKYLVKFWKACGLYLPGPDIGRTPLERLIAGIPGNSWALCGITQTTSSTRAIDAITSLRLWSL